MSRVHLVSSNRLYRGLRQTPRRSWWERLIVWVMGAMLPVMVGCGGMMNESIAKEVKVCRDAGLDFTILHDLTGKVIMVTCEKNIGVR